MNPDDAKRLAEIKVREKAATGIASAFCEHADFNCTLCEAMSDACVCVENVRDRAQRHLAAIITTYVNAELDSLTSEVARLTAELDITRRDYLAAAAHAESLGSAEERIPDGDDDTKPLWHAASPSASPSGAVEMIGHIRDRAKLERRTNADNSTANARRAGDRR